MKHKRVFYTLTVVMYIVVVLLSLAFLFSIKQVKANYDSVTNSNRYLVVEDILNDYKGKNLLFVNTNKIADRIEKDNYLIVKSIKKDFPNNKIVIATNHVSFIRDFIEKEFIVDDIVISAEINMIKPNSNFYNYLLDKYKIEASELLFLDDNIENIDGAYKLGINTIKVDKNTNIYEEILHKIK